MKNKNSISEDELREKVDGFSLNSKSKETGERGYITTDHDVYPPDEVLDKKS